MNDFFYEQIVKRQVGTRENLIKFFVGFISFIACLTLTFFIPFVGLFLGIGAMAIGGYVITTFDVEYEYIVTNSIFEVDYIYAKKRRKKAIEFDLKDVIAIIKLNENKEQHTFNTAKKTLDFTSGANDDSSYKAIFKHDGENVIVKIEPNEKVLEGIKRYCKV